jgi:hypothetical protein
LKLLAWDIWPAALPLLALAVNGAPASPAPPALSRQAPGPLPHEAHVWQWAWTQPVRDGVKAHARDFAGLTVLIAEVAWKDRRPQVVHVSLDYSTLTNAPCPVGLALRIGAYSGPFSTNDATADLLTGLAVSLIAETRANGLAPRELQIDFDCAESRLDGYRSWVEAFRRKAAPVPVRVTALPAWLAQPAFPRLAAAAGSYVLQVHSLDRPRQFDSPWTLCDPAGARQAVARAARLSIPFRVALPTYGYLIAFDTDGRLLGLSAEGPAKTWPASARIREARANPIELAQLVQGWTTNRPANLQGVIWYRLPVASDLLNWRWPTLAAIMDFRSPREGFRAEPRRVEPGLVEISLVNDGELDISSRLAVEVRWPSERGTRLVAGDGLGGFELLDGGLFSVKFQNPTPLWRLPAGDKQVIGWLRLSADREVQVEISKP